MQLLFIVELALILNIAEILFAGRSAITNVLIVSLMWVGLIQLDHHSVMYLATSWPPESSSTAWASRWCSFYTRPTRL